MELNLQEIKNEWGERFVSLIKWSILSIMVGTITGGIGSAFAHTVGFVTELRRENPWILFGLPLGGLLIVYLYKIAGQEKNTGTNQVLSVIRTEGAQMPGIISILILVSTVITHLFGGSSGREGAALQFGASVGNMLGKGCRLNESDRKIIIMASMSAAFAALFGTPMAAAVFSMEVVSVGIMYYAALVPCMMSAFTAQYVAWKMGVRVLKPAYLIEEVPVFYSIDGVKVIALAVVFALAGVFFCKMLHHSEHSFKKWFPNPYLRIAAGALAVIALRFILGTDHYLGLGEEILHRSFQEPVSLVMFLLKILFTCLTLSVGFKGGEIVPSLFVGATLGSALSVYFQLPPNLCAACGMVGVFCSVTNCPVSSILIALELFGVSGMPFYCIVIAVGYLISGYQSLYKEQKIMYSKTENKFINKATE